MENKYKTHFSYDVIFSLIEKASKKAKELERKSLSEEDSEEAEKEDTKINPTVEEKSELILFVKNLEKKKEEPAAKDLTPQELIQRHLQKYKERYLPDNAGMIEMLQLAWELRRFKNNFNLDEGTSEAIESLIGEEEDKESKN